MIDEKHYFNFCYSKLILHLRQSPFSCIEEKKVKKSMILTMSCVNLFLRI